MTRSAIGVETTTGSRLPSRPRYLAAAVNLARRLVNMVRFAAKPWSKVKAINGAGARNYATDIIGLQSASSLAKCDLVSQRQMSASVAS
jgi:hypothetical protein